jgi:glycosyltransferase involved in cell wall biosynthesis
MNHTSGKPRLLVLTTTFPRWRDDHEPAFVFDLARRLTDTFDVSVSAPHAPGALLNENMEGVQVHRFRYAPERLELLAYDGGIPSKLKQRPWLTFLVPWFLTAQLVSAFRLMRRIRPDIVHAHWLLPGGLIGALLQELPGADFRLVVTAHGADVHLTGGWLSGLLKREVLRSADLLTVVSRALRQKLLQSLPQAAIEVAPMGVDLQTRFVPGHESPETDTLVFAGRLVAKKGVADLLEALPRVRARRPEARLLIAGQGPLEADLRALAERLQIGDAVEFLGSVSNDRLPAVLHRADLAVLPFCTADDGDAEGLGLVTVEAMGAGIPVIVGDVAAVHDVITHGETGWIVPARNPAALADAIVRLLEDPALAARLAGKGRRYAAQTFDWSVVAARYRTLLRALSD